jgi:hypothetical protein
MPGTARKRTSWRSRHVASKATSRWRGRSTLPTPSGNPLGPLTQAMQRKLKRAGRRSRYRFRKQIVEPVFGQIKAARGFRQFLLRGIDKVSAEWAMICTAHNLLKLARAAS